MKNRNNDKRMTVKEAKNTIKLLTYCVGILSVVVMALAINVSCKKSSIRELEARNANLIIQAENRSKTNSALLSVVNDLDCQLENVASINSSMVDELDILRKRSELYDKYEYAIVNELGRTQLTYEEVQYAEDLMLEKGLNPHLLVGSIVVESTCNPEAVHPDTKATGYGQILNSTGKWIWEDLMGNTGYYPDLRKDGISNIAMMATYYDYLYSKHDTTLGVVKAYSGNSTDDGAREYLNKINSVTQTVGVTIEE